MSTSQETRSTRELRALRRESFHVETTTNEAMNSNTAAPAPAAVTARKARQTSGHKRQTRGSQDAQKKARPTSVSASSENVARTYNLRSLTAPKIAPAPEAAPRVTPGSLVRHLDFKEADQSSSSNESVATCTEGLPQGVVNIFSTRPAVKSCTCLHDVSFQQNSSLAFSHICNYGKEYGDILREKEDREMSELYAVLPIQSENRLADDDSDDSDDESRPGTPRPGTVLKYRPRALSMKQSRSGPSEKIEKLPRQPFLSPKMRSILVNWLVEVAQEYKVSADGYHLAITLLDLILSRGPSAQQLVLLDIDDSDDEDEDEDMQKFLVLRHEFQALGCACAWIGSKMEDKDSPSYDDLVYISDHSFSSDKLRQLETRICKELQFRLHRVTPLHFVNEFLRANHACPDRSCEFDHAVLRQMVMYLLELCRIPYELTASKPSLLAAASLYLARATLGLRETDSDHAVDSNGYWTKTLQYYTGYAIDDLKKTVLTIHQYQLAAEESNFNASFNKYRSRAFKAVSLKTALRVEDLGFDATVNYDDLKIDESGARFSGGAAK